MSAKCGERWSALRVVFRASKRFVFHKLETRFFKQNNENEKPLTPDIALNSVPNEIHDIRNQIEFYIFLIFIRDYT